MRRKPVDAVQSITNLTYDPDGVEIVKLKEEKEKLKESEKNKVASPER